MAFRICRDATGNFWRHLTLSEVSGALGDLGTFLPLVVGLVKTAGLDLGTTLLFTGIYNIITGFLFDLPIPVQPMKTIAAVALAEAGALTLPQIMAAGIFVSACILFLGITGLMGLVTRLIPLPIIRGMQLGLGLNLAFKGWQQVWYANGKGPPSRQWWTIEGLFLGLAAVVFIVITIYPRSVGSEEEGRREKADEKDKHQQAEEEQQPVSITIEIVPAQQQQQQHDVRASFWERVLSPLWALGDAATAACDDGNSASPCSSSLKTAALVPSALVIVILGVILTIATSPSVVSTLSLGPSKPQVIVPSSQDWKTGILRAGLPQLPLTAFNSVLSVCQLANQLFPDRPVRPSTMAASVGAMNMVGCWFGAMPSCHGAGGLAGQVRFGARYGAAPIFLGILKVTLSLIFGSSLFALLQKFPSPLLGAMLVFAGVELAIVARGQRGERGMAMMMFTAAVVLAMNNVAIGVAAGIIAAYLLALKDWIVDTAFKLINKLKN